MTSIKPTTGPLTTPTHTPEVSGADAAEALERASEVNDTGGLSSVSQGHAAGASAGVPIASSTATAGGVQAINLVDLAKAVEAGQLTMGQAVERLVEGTVGSLPRQLTELERAELSELLRSAVSSDPTLSAMQDDSA